MWQLLNEHPAGYRVQIDDNEYEDIWYVAALLLV